MSLKTEMTQLLDDSLRLCRTCNTENKKFLEDAIIQMQNRLNQPLRVAVVGIMKAGKSTFLNALMGANLLYTGELETTYTVGWFHYGDEARIVVHFRGNSETEDAPIEDLAKWTVRDSKKNNPRLDDVEYIDIFYPSNVLKTIEFIDTPGLNSPQEIDAKNTEIFLGIDAERASDITIEEAGKADAIIYAFSRAVSKTDQDALNAFYEGKGASASPINSVGILTKVDGTGIWSVMEEATPVEKGLQLTSSMMARNGIEQKVFYTVLPVCTKPCEGTLKLSDEDWRTLKHCSELEEKELQKQLYSAEKFYKSEDAIGNRIGTTDERKRIMSVLGQYGILEISRQIKSGLAEEEIRDKMSDLCGLNQVRDIVEKHFGLRAFLIKSQYALNYIRHQIMMLRKMEGQDKQLLSVCNQISTKIDNFSGAAQSMRELEALKMYYSNLITFDNDDEKDDFLRLMGEKGRTVEARLGIKGTESVAMLAQLAKEKSNYWNAKANGYFVPNNLRSAATITSRSCDELYFHLNEICE